MFASQPVPRPPSGASESQKNPSSSFSKRFFEK